MNNSSTARRFAYWTAFACATSVFGIAPLAAQRPLPRQPRADTLSKGAFEDSLKVVRALDQITRKNPHDTTAWFRRGMAAFSLAEQGSWRRPPFGIGREEMAAIAEQSIARAVSLDTTNARFWLALSHFRRTIQTTAGQNAAGEALERAVRVARTQRDSSTLITALTELGGQLWSQWSVQARVGIPLRPREEGRWAGTVWGPAGSLWSAAIPDTNRDLPQLLATAIRHVREKQRSQPFETPVNASFRRAHDVLRELYLAAPETPRIYQRLVQMMTAAGRWTEVDLLAREQIARNPRDAWAWMALGLSQHRSGGTALAKASFDSGYRQLNPVERAQVDRVDRILSWSDSVAYSRADAATQALIAERTWLLADPLWAEGTGKTRQEFLARIAYTELRWGSPDSDVHPVDVDIGETYLRYGPPSEVLNGFWLYDHDLMLAPYSFPSAIRKQEGLENYELTERIQDWRPSRWSNVTSTRIDSMPTQVVRFRASNDSVSIFVATEAPADSVKGSIAKSVKPSTQVWLAEAKTRNMIRDSLALAGGATQWSRTVAQGTYYYRFETVAAGAPMAGRSAGTTVAGTDSATGFAASGFGLSDLLLTKRLTEGDRPTRWTDLRFTALTGELARGSTVGLVWENYELSNRSGNAEYSVKIIIERKYKLFLNRVRARVINAWAAMMGDEQTANRMVFWYDRSAAYAPAFADYVTLQLADTPAGNYDVTLEITDRGTGQITSRTKRITILD